MTELRYTKKTKSMSKRKTITVNVSMFLLIIALIISEHNTNKTAPGHHSVNIYQVL
jgi:hypothetical protein